jgi:hypothetical protein
MAYDIRRVDYFYTTVQDKPGEAYKVLSQVADLGINLLAFTSIPVGPFRTQFTIFPEDTLKMKAEAVRIGLNHDGPHPAILVQGKDALGALAEIHAKLSEKNINVYASTGVTDGKGCFGYIIYVRPEEYSRATSVLSI